MHVVVEYKFSSIQLSFCILALLTVVNKMYDFSELFRIHDILTAVSYGQMSFKGLASGRMRLVYVAVIMLPICYKLITPI